MTKLQMINEMVGTNKKPDFYKRATRKSSEYINRLYNYFKKDMANPAHTEKETRGFCFSLLNK